MFGARHNACYSSPDYERKVMEINTRLAQRYKDHPALLLWHVSNEYNNECHCPLCQARFREWLKERYGTIENLNRQWWNGFWSHRYNSFEEINSPSSIGDGTPCLHLAWKRFSTDNLIRFFQTEIAPLRKYTPNVPVTANLMHTSEVLDYFKLGRELDVSSWDNYPPWTGDERDLQVSRHSAFCHDLMRGVCDQKPFLLMESSPSAVNWQPINRLRKPGTLLFQGLQAIAHGSDSVQYFQYRAGRGGSEQFHGAVIDRTGTNQTRAFREVAQVGETLKKLKCVAGSETRNEIALLYDWNIRWTLDLAQLLHNDNHQDYVNTVSSFHYALSALGYGVDVVDETCDFNRYKVLVIPMGFMIREGFEEKVEKFAAEGGTVVLTYLTGYMNEEMLTYLDAAPCRLNAVSGIHVDECDALDDQTFAHFEWNGKQYEVNGLAELSHITTAEVLASYADRFYAGQPVLTRNSFGKGVCYYIAARTGEDFLRDALGYVTDQTGLKPLAARRSEGVDVTARYQDGVRYLFAANNTHESGSVTFESNMRDVLTGEAIGNTCSVDGLTIRVLTDD